MLTINDDTLADVRFTLLWDSQGARHTEILSARGLNLWRDILPGPVYSALEGKFPGFETRLSFEAGKLIDAAGPNMVRLLSRKQFGSPGKGIEPRRGRFYPKGLLKDLPNIFPQNVEPFRCTQVQNGHIGIDFNHPLAGKGLDLLLEVEAVRAKENERGGASRVWMEELASGPGMQVRYGEDPTDFFSDAPFARADESADSNFYENPRMVHHIDARAASVVRDIYRRYLKPGMTVLDLMSSWVSHLPEEVRPVRVTGLGMNRQELDANPVLTERVIHDLNLDPILPFGARSFNAAVCTVSVEYLTHPNAIFEELARVLRPGAPLVVTFSDRWFPPKAVRIWTELHEFERMGLVSEYFLATGAFDGIETFSVRGLPRPMDDKYFPQRIYADPVFAVAARRVD